MEETNLLSCQQELPLTSRSTSRLTKEEKEEAKRALETQVGGGHYKDFAIQPIEFSMRNRLNACQHSIVKYVLRYNRKGTPRQDLEKAKHFIDLLISLENL